MNKMSEILLNKFDMNVVNDNRCKKYHPFIVIVGDKKNNILLDVLDSLRTIPSILFFSNNELDESFNKHKHKIFRYEKYDFKILQDVYTKQVKLIKGLQQKGYYSKHHGLLDICIIFDNINSDECILKDEILRELIFSGRHFGITIILKFNNMIELTPEFNTSVEFLFVCKNNDIGIDILYKHFFGIFDKQSTFNKVLDKYTKNDSCLVMNYTSRSSKICDYLHWYKS